MKKQIEFGRVVCNLGQDMGLHPFELHAALIHLLASSTMALGRVSETSQSERVEYTVNSYTETVDNMASVDIDSKMRYTSDE